MDHFLVGSRSLLLAISQGRKLPATAHSWFSSYSKLCGSLSRTSTKGERWVGGDGHLRQTDCANRTRIQPCDGVDDLVLGAVSACRQWPPATLGHRKIVLKSLFLFCEGRSCRLLV